MSRIASLLSLGRIQAIASRSKAGAVPLAPMLGALGFTRPRLGSPSLSGWP